MYVRQPRPQQGQHHALAVIAPNAQHPVEDRLVFFQGDPLSRLGQRRMIRRGLARRNPKKITQAQRIRCAPRDAALAIDTLKSTPAAGTGKYTPRRQARPPPIFLAWNLAHTVSAYRSKPDSPRILFIAR